MPGFTHALAIAGTRRSGRSCVPEADYSCRPTTVRVHLQFFSGKPNSMVVFLGAGSLMSPDGRVWHEPRAAPLSGAPQPRHSTTPRAHLHHPAVHIAPAQPASPHWPISTVARCGEGALAGGWHAGASPSTPIMRWVVNRWSSSASFARPYTLGRSRRTFILRLAHDQGRVGDRVFRCDLLPGDCRLHELDRVPLM